MAETFDPYHRWLGIPREEQPPHFYRLLGLNPFESEPDVIENAADQRMVHLRTFQAGKNGPLSQKLLNEISAAKVCLLDPAKKAAYDAALREKFTPASPPPAAIPTAVVLAGNFTSDHAQRTMEIRVRNRPTRKRSSPLLALGMVAVAAIAIGALIGAIIVSRTSLQVATAEKSPIVARQPPSDHSAVPPANTKKTPSANAPDASKLEAPSTETTASKKTAKSKLKAIETNAAPSEMPVANAPAPSTTNPSTQPSAPPSPEPDRLPKTNKTATKQRAAEPNPAEQTPIRQKLTANYGHPGKQSFPERTQTAVELFDLAKQAPAGSVEQYVHLREAQRWAIDALNSRLAVDVTEMLRTEFDINLAVELPKLITSLSIEAKEDNRSIDSILEAAIPLAQRISNEKQFDAAQKTLDALGRIALRSTGRKYVPKVAELKIKLADALKAARATKSSNEAASKTD